MGFYDKNKNQKRDYNGRSSYGNNKGGYHKTERKPYVKPVSAKPDPTTFVQTFDTFEDGMNAVYAVSSFLNELFEGAVVAGIVYKKLAEIITVNTPDPVTRENIVWEAQISGNKCSLKTNKWVTLGWSIKSKKNEDGTYTSSYRFTLTYLNECGEEFKSDMNDKRWTIETKPVRRGR